MQSKYSIIENVRRTDISYFMSCRCYKVDAIVYSILKVLNFLKCSWWQPKMKHHMIANHNTKHINPLVRIPITQSIYQQDNMSFSWHSHQMKSLSSAAICAWAWADDINRLKQSSSTITPTPIKLHHKSLHQWERKKALRRSWAAASFIHPSNLGLSVHAVAPRPPADQAMSP